MLLCRPLHTTSEQYRTHISSLCCSPNTSMINLKALKRVIHKRSPEPSFKIPLTERNVESLNAQDTESTEEQDYFKQLEEQDASHKLRRSREVQISEWLRLLP